MQCDEPRDLISFRRSIDIDRRKIKLFTLLNPAPKLTLIFVNKLPSRKKNIPSVDFQLQDIFQLLDTMINSCSLSQHTYCALRAGNPF